MSKIIIVFIVPFIILAGFVFITKNKLTVDTKKDLEITEQLMQKSNVSSDGSVTSTTIENLQWQDYQNKVLGIQFRFPTTWFLAYETDKEVGIVSTDPKNGGNLAGLRIEVKYYPNEFTEITFLEKLDQEYLGYCSGDIELNKTNLKTLSIGNHSARTGDCDAAPENLWDHYYFVYNENKIYKITATEDIGFPERNEKVILTSIISNLKFL